MGLLLKDIMTMMTTILPGEAVEVARAVDPDLVARDPVQGREAKE